VNPALFSARPQERPKPFPSYNEEECSNFAARIFRLMQQTLILLKPDCIHRRLVGTITQRFEQKGMRLAGLKLVQASRQLAERHYAVHKGKGFCESLLQFITSGPTVAMVWEGPDAVQVARNLIGQTDGAKAAAGTIRGDFAIVVQNNLVHGSDSPENAAAEIALWFRPEELVSYSPVDRPWVAGT
jgi:nucleoside-diphosphate kinase